MGDVLGLDAIGAGVNTSSGINFEVSDPATHLSLGGITPEVAFQVRWSPGNDDDLEAWQPVTTGVTIAGSASQAGSTGWVNTMRSPSGVAVTACISNTERPLGVRRWSPNCVPRQFQLRKARVDGCVVLGKRVEV